MNNMDNYEQLHKIASRDWFKSSSVSLAKLDEIKASVYNISPNKTPQSLRPSSASVQSRSQKGSYTDIQTEPPLSGVNLQQSSWNNNPSVPHLIKQQGERQQRRTTSAKGPRRPWSGRKVPPSPTQQKQDDTQDRYKAFIAVKGAKYDPQSRPPSGRPTTSPPGQIGDGITKRTADMALEDFLKVYQASGEITDVAKLSAAYAPEDSVTPPPPVPRTSPDMQEMLYGDTAEDINRMLYGDSDGDISDEEEKADSLRLAQVKEVAVKQPSVPQLLRRPTPVRLSMTIPAMGCASDEEDYYEQDQRYNGSPSAIDMELQSVTSEVSGNLDKDDIDRCDTWAGGIRSVTMTSSRHQNTPVAEDEDNSGNVGSFDREGAGDEGRRSVRIDETRNITTEISPRGEAYKEPLKPHPPPAKQRPKSAVVARTHYNDTKVSSDGTSGRQRPKSARVRNLRLATVALDYGAQADVIEQNEHADIDQLARTESHVPERPEIVTMMSRISLSDDEDNQNSKNEPTEHTVQYSKTSSKTNFYKAATGSTQATLTTKTIAFTDAGILESKTVSKIGQVQKPPVGRVGLFGAGRLVSAKKRQPEAASVEPRTHSAITRPMRNNATLNTNNPSDRPASRMGRRLDDGDDLDDMCTTAESNGMPKKTSRPVSAPVRRRAGAGSSGRKSPSKMSTRRPKSAAAPLKQTYIDKPHIALQSGSQSMKGITPARKSALEKQRNRAAVNALKDGTLNKDKKYSGRIAFEETKHVVEYTPRRQESSESSEEEIEIPLSEQDKQMHEMHERLLARGVNVSAKTLARGLLPPSQREYDECTGQLPKKPSMTLLNHPEAWLGDVFKKYKMAEKALHRANLRMVEQEELDAKLAAKKALESTKKKKRKKGKKRKIKKKVIKNSSVSKD